VAVAVAVVMWGSAPLLVRAIDSTTATIVLWRTLITVPLAIGVAYATGGRLSWRLLRGSAPAAVCFAGSMVAAFMAFRETSIANATLIAALQPALVFLVARRLFAEHRSRTEMSWGIVALGGVAIVVLSASRDDASWSGDLFAVASLGLFTGFFLLAKRARVGNVHTWSFLAAVFLVSGVIVMPWAVAVSGGVQRLHGVDWVYALLIAVCSGMLGHGLVMWAHRYVDISVTSMLTLANPVISIAGAWIVFSESMRPVQIAGAAVVLMALAVIVRHQRGARLIAAQPALGVELIDAPP
jgi:drug/metabolite transporter (DMT)-like permease